MSSPAHVVSTLNRYLYLDSPNVAFLHRIGLQREEVEGHDAPVLSIKLSFTFRYSPHAVFLRLQQPQSIPTPISHSSASPSSSSIASTDSEEWKIASIAASHLDLVSLRCDQPTNGLLPPAATDGRCVCYTPSPVLSPSAMCRRRSSALLNCGIHCSAPSRAASASCAPSSSPTPRVGSRLSPGRRLPPPTSDERCCPLPQLTRPLLLLRPRPPSSPSISCVRCCSPP